MSSLRAVHLTHRNRKCSTVSLAWPQAHISDSTAPILLRKPFSLGGADVCSQPRGPGPRDYYPCSKPPPVLRRVLLRGPYSGVDVPTATYMYKKYRDPKKPRQREHGCVDNNLSCQLRNI